MDKDRVTILNNEKYLRKTSREVDFNDKTYLENIKKLEKYCKENEVFAMAAIQIGIPKRIIYLKNTTTDFSKNAEANYNEAKVMINPVILEREGHTRFLEGCASCLTEEGKYICSIIDRPYRVVVKYYDMNGIQKEERLEGFETVVFSHENDHLNGILHFDLVEEKEIIPLTKEEMKNFREKNPYEMISKTCNYEEITNKKR
jgi:N-formylmethionyl-tRNA deformylase